MRYGLLIYLLLLIPSISWSQERSFEQAQEFYSYNEFDSALFFADEARVFAEQNNDRLLLAKSLHLMGASFESKQQFANSLDYYLRSSQEYTKLNDNENNAKVNLDIGDLYTDWEIPIKALEYYDKAYQTYSEGDLLEDRVTTLEKIGRTRELTTEYEGAISAYQEILTILDRLDRKSESLKVLRRISDLLIKHNQHAQALAFDLEILTIQESIGDQSEIAATLNNIGYIYNYLNEKELALQYFLESHEVLKEINADDEFYVGDMIILVNVGLIYQSMLDYQTALNYFFEALKTKDARDNPLEMSRIYNYISFTYNYLSNLEKSELFAETAINLAELYDANEILIDSYKSLSDIHSQLGNHQSALAFFKKYVQIKDSLASQEMEMRQAELQRRQEVDKKEQEIKLLIVEQEIKDLALRELTLESNQRERDIDILRTDQEIQWIRLQNQQAQKEKAEQALRLTQTQLDAEKKDNEISLLQKDKYIQSLALKQNDLEQKERDREIELLERNKALQELELVRQQNLIYFILGAFGLLLVILFLIYRSYVVNRRAKVLLEGQNEEINRQKEEISDQHFKLEKSYDNMKLLGEIANEITSNLSIDKINKVVYKHVQKLMAADNFGIGIYNEDGNSLSFSDPVQMGEVINSFEISLEEKNRLPVYCFSKKKEILIKDYSEDYLKYVNQYEPSRTGETAKSIIYQPLVVKNKAIGAITVQSYEKDAFDEYHLSILRSLAIHVAIAMENAFAYEQIAEKSKILENALSELKSAQAQLVQAEKMASLGELTAGIAHEINNPINFVYAGVDGLKSSLEGLVEVLNKYGELDEFHQAHQATALLADIRQLKHELYFDETKKGVFEVVEAIKEGAMRTSEIVDGLRNFSRLDEGDLKLANIHVGIENTLVLLSPKIKDGQVKLIKYYDDIMPEINCYPGQLNQVFMNLLSNAMEAIPDEGTIAIRTINYDDFVTISIVDDGRGIPPEIKSKIFEPFFTTKGLGKGTGLGLSISFGIIQKHHGKIEVNSKPNKGAEFVITIPKDLA